MNTHRPNNLRTRLAVFAIVAVSALAFSTKFAGELTAAPRIASRQAASQGSGDPDRFVTELPGNPAPRYPDILKQAGVTGGVLVSFVVDTAGVADPQSMRFFVSSHQLFLEAVKSALPGWRFLPAVVNGKKVKQVVRMPVVFGLSTSAGQAADFYVTTTEKLLSDPASSKFVAIPAVLVTGMIP